MKKILLTVVTLIITGTCFANPIPLSDSSFRATIFYRDSTMAVMEINLHDYLYQAGLAGHVYFQYREAGSGDNFTVTDSLNYDADWVTNTYFFNGTTEKLKDSTEYEFGAVVYVNGVGYYFQDTLLKFTTLKTPAVSSIAESVQKSCSITAVGKQLQVKSSAEYMDASLQVYNILGEEVAHGKIENEKQPIDLSGRASGAYLVSLEPATSLAKKVVMRIYISP